MYYTRWSISSIGGVTVWPVCAYRASCMPFTVLSAQVFTSNVTSARGCSRRVSSLPPPPSPLCKKTTGPFTVHGDGACGMGPGMILVTTRAVTVP